MNAASLERSDRLMKVRSLLRKGEWFSTMEIIQRTGVCAINSAISELRANGLGIECERRGKAWFYRMLRDDCLA